MSEEKEAALPPPKKKNKRKKNTGKANKRKANEKKENAAMLTHTELIQHENPLTAMSRQDRLVMLRRKGELELVELGNAGNSTAVAIQQQHESSVSPALTGTKSQMKARHVAPTLPSYSGQSYSCRHELATTYSVREGRR